MSDFGTIIIATKINSTGFEEEITETDEENLSEVLAKLISHFQTLNAEGDLMNAQFEYHKSLFYEKNTVFTLLFTFCFVRASISN